MQISVPNFCEKAFLKVSHNDNMVSKFHSFANDIFWSFLSPWQAIRILFLNKFMKKTFRISKTVSDIMTIFGTMNDITQTFFLHCFVELYQWKFNLLQFPYFFGFMFIRKWFTRNHSKSTQSLHSISIYVAYIGIWNFVLHDKTYISLSIFIISFHSNYEIHKLVKAHSLNYSGRFGR